MTTFASLKNVNLLNCKELKFYILVFLKGILNLLGHYYFALVFVMST